MNLLLSLEETILFQIFSSLDKVFYISLPATKIVNREKEIFYDKKWQFIDYKIEEHSTVRKTATLPIHFSKINLHHTEVLKNFEFDHIRPWVIWIKIPLLKKIKFDNNEVAQILYEKNYEAVYISKTNFIYLAKEQSSLKLNLFAPLSKKNLLYKELLEQHKLIQKRLFKTKVIYLLKKFFHFKPIFRKVNYFFNKLFLKKNFYIRIFKKTLANNFMYHAISYIPFLNRYFYFNQRIYIIYLTRNHNNLKRSFYHNFLQEEIVQAKKNL